MDDKDKIGKQHQMPGMSELSNQTMNAIFSFKT